MNFKYYSFILLVGTFVLLLAATASAEVFGADTITLEGSSRASDGTPVNNSALAGNVTGLLIDGSTITRSWQGYFGNVTGTIILADSSNNMMYNWSIASPRGQIYSSVNDSGIQWSYLQCFNFTSSGEYSDDTANAGGTSLYGMNLTQLHSLYNIDSSGFDGSIRSSRDDDAVDHTFTYFDDGTGVDGKGHRLFYSTSLDFTEGECRTARIFGPHGTQAEDEFEEVLMYEPASGSVVFTSLLNEDLDGFDQNTHDFQMLVLEDGHGTDTDTTPYFFYVELN